jgi:hypothetical protein
MTTIRHGMLFVLRMANSAVDFRQQFSDPNLFPHAVFNPADLHNEAVYSKLVRPSDLTQGFFVPRFASFDVCDPTGPQQIDQGWRLIITSSFLLAEYEQYLQDAIILDHCGVIVVRTAGEEY